MVFFIQYPLKKQVKFIFSDQSEMGALRTFQTDEKSAYVPARQNAGEEQRGGLLLSVILFHLFRVPPAQP